MSEHEPEATPQQQEAVRRLLAGARHDEPVPADVVARLDGVLAQLAAEGPRAIDPAPPAPHEAEVVDLAARRRRRVTGLLGAAAAVVVLGVGISQVVDTTSGGDAESSSDSAKSSVAGEQADDDAGASAEDAPAPSAPLASEPTSGMPVKPGKVPAISKKTFGQAVLTLRGAAVVPSTDSDRVGGDELTTVPMFVCPPAAFGEGRLLAVRYEGAPAVLAYRSATGETQSVELLQCGTAEVLRSKVIPFP